MALNFTTTRKAAVANGVKMLVYGQAGVGKTCLCATAPAPLIVSAEAGLLSLRNVDLPVIEVKTIEDVEDVFNFVTTSADAKKFETICLDSISEIAEVVLSTAKKFSNDPRQAYGELIDTMSILLRKFRDIPGKNIYFSAKELQVNNPETGITTIGPLMPGSKLGDSLPYLFDEVFRLNVGRKKDKDEKFRYLQTENDFKIQAKDRSGCLDAIEKPDLTYIINKIKNNIKGEKNNG